MDRSPDSTTSPNPYFVPSRKPVHVYSDPLTSWVEWIRQGRVATGAPTESIWYKWYHRPAATLPGSARHRSVTEVFATDTSTGGSALSGTVAGTRRSAALEPKLSGSRRASSSRGGAPASKARRFARAASALAAALRAVSLAATSPTATPTSTPTACVAIAAANSARVMTPSPSLSSASNSESVATAGEPTPAAAAWLAAAAAAAAAALLAPLAGCSTPTERVSGDAAAPAAAEGCDGSSGDCTASNGADPGVAARRGPAAARCGVSISQQP